MKKDQLVQRTEYETLVHEPVVMKVVKCYTTYGVQIYVELDRHKKTATIVEPSSSGDWKPKEFQFAKRTKEYMDGWIAIFRACEQAIRLAKEDLEKFNDDEMQKLLDMHVALNKMELQEVVHNESD